MFGTQTMASARNVQFARWRDLLMKAVVVGTFVLFSGLAMIDDLLFIFR
jgi:hypothetical protein